MQGIQTETCPLDTQSMQFLEVDKPRNSSALEARLDTPETSRGTAKKLFRSFSLAGSLCVYWISTLFCGRIRTRLVEWAYSIDNRNKLALNDLVERRPSIHGGAAQSAMQRWIHTIIDRDPLAFATVAEQSARTRQNAPGQAWLAGLIAARCKKPFPPAGPFGRASSRSS